MKNQNQDSPTNECRHEKVKREGGYLVCENCGLILDENVDFMEDIPISDFKYNDSQLDYERSIRIRDSRAKQDPIIKQKYDKIQMLEKWYRDYETSFTEQKRTIELLKSYGIGLTIDKAKFQDIKKRYLTYLKKHRQTYQNMVIIFLAIVWLEIKDTTNIRIERYIKVCNELGHKTGKKMLNNAMLKIKKTEKIWKKYKSLEDIETEIKNRVKILFEKDLNNIPYDKVKNIVPSKGDYEKLKVELLLVADKLLKRIPYENLQNLNYKAFTAGLIYYIGQSLEGKENRKIFTQALIEETTKFSSTTIRKKFHILKDILGEPKEQKNLPL